MSNQLEIQQAPFLFLNDHPNQYFESYTEAFNNGNKTLNNVGVDSSFIIKETLHSTRNIDIIQRWTIIEVERKTGITIPYQNEKHVRQAIEGIWQAYGQNLPFNLKKQITDLDYKIVITLVEAIITELYTRMRYHRDIESANFIENPIYVGSKGQRVLPSTCTTL